VVKPGRAFQGILSVKLLAFSSRGFLRSDAGKLTRFSFIRVRAVNKRTVELIEGNSSFKIPDYEGGQLGLPYNPNKPKI
jgi:hypothetical protein